MNCILLMNEMKDMQKAEMVDNWRNVMLGWPGKAFPEEVTFKLEAE